MTNSYTAMISDLEVSHQETVYKVNFIFFLIELEVRKEEFLPDILYKLSIVFVILECELQNIPVIFIYGVIFFL